MSKLDEMGGHKYTAGFLVAHSDERVKAAGRDILALIERVEELDKQLQAARELAERVNNTGPRIAQVFDGWHNDGTAWTEYDESVRREVRELQVVAGKFMEGINP